MLKEKMYLFNPKVEDHLCEHRKKSGRKCSILRNFRIDTMEIYVVTIHIDIFTLVRKELPNIDKV